MNSQGRKIAIFGWTDSVHVERWARGLMGRDYRIKVISPVEDKLDDIDPGKDFIYNAVWNVCHMMPRLTTG